METQKISKKGWVKSSYFFPYFRKNDEDGYRCMICNEDISKSRTIHMRICHFPEYIETKMKVRYR